MLGDFSKPQLYFNPEIEYQIESKGGQNDSGQKGSFMGIELTRNHAVKKRSQNSRWAYIHKLGEGFSQCNIRWKFIPQGYDNVYKIVVAGGQFTGHQLFCFQDIEMDFRDKVPSFYAFVCPSGYMNKFNKWKVIKYANNIFLIKNTDNNCYLSSHRCYKDKDVRDKNSTFVMGFSYERGATYWKIKPF